MNQVRDVKYLLMKLFTLIIVLLSTSIECYSQGMFARSPWLCSDSSKEVLDIGQFMYAEINLKDQWDNSIVVGFGEDGKVDRIVHCRENIDVLNFHSGDTVMIMMLSLLENNAISLDSITDTSFKLSEEYYEECTHIVRFEDISCSLINGRKVKFTENRGSIRDKVVIPAMWDAPEIIEWHYEREGKDWVLVRTIYKEKARRE